jgi:FtsZ-binding cell division protein ZapB
MEYEILNDILTGTVSSLFRGKFKEIQETMRASLTSLPPPNSSDWVKVEGKQKLEQSLRKLKLDYMATNGRDLGSKSYEDLVTEKKKVKNELKNYDNNFKNLFGRVPRREEKEPMRPLYVYYKKLKISLTKRANEKPQPKRMTREETVKRIEELKKERSELKAILHNFQMEFSQTNHRRIRYHRDIAPVENEYKRYKEVKAELSKLESS